MIYWIHNDIHWHYVKWKVFMCTIYGWGVMESYSNAVRGLAWSESKLCLFIFYFSSEDSPSPRASFYFIRLHFRNFQQLWVFSFMICWSWVSVFKLGRGENEPWKWFVPTQASNSNLRSFIDVHINIMHTYRRIKQWPSFPLKLSIGKQEMTSFENRIVSQKHLYTVFQTAWN